MGAGWNKLRLRHQYRLVKIMKSKSWRTTSLGAFAIALSLFAFKKAVEETPNQTFLFRLSHNFIAPIALAIVGWGLIHARDHRAQD